MSMPYRVQRIEEFVKELESGDLKLRVRVLEVCNLNFKYASLAVQTSHPVMYTNTTAQVQLTWVKLHFGSRKELHEKQQYYRWRRCIQSWEVPWWTSGSLWAVKAVKLSQMDHSSVQVTCYSRTLCYKNTFCSISLHSSKLLPLCRNLSHAVS